MGINLQGRMPDGNGLSAIAADMIRQGSGLEQRKLYVAIAIIDVAKLTTNADTHETVPTARVRRIEVVDGGDDRGVAEGLMRRALDRRTGREALPYDLEQELRGVFEAADEDGNPAGGVPQ